jgi:hypothetical protein
LSAKPTATNPGYQDVIVFDFQKLLILIYDAHGVRSLPFETIAKRSVTIADFAYQCSAVVDPSEQLVETAPNNERWDPKVCIDRRNRRFLESMLNAFGLTWSHILSTNYNIQTIKVMTKAIIELASNSFTIHEQTEKVKPPQNWPRVGEDLPQWDAIAEADFLIGDVRFIVCQIVRDGQLRACAMAQSIDLELNSGRPHFVIFSVRHIMLARVTQDRKLNFTMAQQFFIGERNYPTSMGIKYLFWATEKIRPYVSTPLQNLPLEIQNCIMDHVSEMLMVSAQLGCILGIGFSYNKHYRGTTIVVCYEKSTERSGLPYSRILITPGSCAILYGLARIKALKYG